MASSPEAHIMDVLGDGCGEPVAYAFVAFRSMRDLTDAAARERARRFVIGLHKRGDIRVFHESSSERTDMQLIAPQKLLAEDRVWTPGTPDADAVVMEASPEALKRWETGDFS